MLLLWMKAFRKPNEEQNTQLIKLYMSLSEKNRKTAGRKYKAIIAFYLTIAVACLIATLIYMAFGLFYGGYNVFYLILDILFAGLSIYAIYTSSSWIGAKPYQKFLINIDIVEKLYNSQENSQLKQNNENTDEHIKLDDNLETEKSTKIENQDNDK